MQGGHHPAHLWRQLPVASEVVLVAGLPANEPAMVVFARVLRRQMNAARFGWELLAVARRPSDLSS
jgi:hypothetical protein